MLDAKQTVFIDMAMIINQARNHLDEAFEAYQLSRQEWLIMGLLRLKPEGISQSYIKSYLSVETSYLTKLLNGLEDRDLIVRHIDKSDRRNRIVQASKKYPKKIKAIFDVIQKFNEKIGVDLSDEAIAQMQISLDQIKKQLKQLRKF